MNVGQVAAAEATLPEEARPGWVLSEPRFQTGGQAAAFSTGSDSIRVRAIPTNPAARRFPGLLAGGLLITAGGRRSKAMSAARAKMGILPPFAVVGWAMGTDGWLVPKSEAPRAENPRAEERAARYEERMAELAAQRVPRDAATAALVSAWQRVAARVGACETQAKAAKAARAATGAKGKAPAGAARANGGGGWERGQCPHAPWFSALESRAAGKPQAVWCGKEGQVGGRAAGTCRGLWCAVLNWEMAGNRITPALLESWCAEEMAEAQRTAEAARAKVAGEADSVGRQALQPLLEAEWQRMRSSEGWDEEAAWPFFLVGNVNLVPNVGLGVAPAMRAYAMRTARELLRQARAADAAAPGAAAAAAAIVGRVVETAAREAAALTAESEAAWAEAETMAAGKSLEAYERENAATWMAAEALLGAALPSPEAVGADMARGAEDVQTAEGLTLEAVRAAHAAAKPRALAALVARWAGEVDELAMPALSRPPGAVRRLDAGGAGGEAGDAPPPETAAAAALPAGDAVGEGAMDTEATEHAAPEGEAGGAGAMDTEAAVPAAEETAAGELAAAAEAPVRDPASDAMLD